MSSPDIASTAPPRATVVDDQVAEADRSRPRAAVKNRRKLYLDLVGTRLRANALTRSCV